MRPSRKEELIEFALKIFNRDGYTATGMDRLVLETGISKTTMYKYFGSKEALILAVLRARDDAFFTWLFDEIDLRPDPTTHPAIALFDVLSDWFASPDFHGCMFVKAASEFLDPDDALRRQAGKHKQRLLDRLKAELEPTHGARAETLAAQILMLKEGATVAAHMGFSDQPAQKAKEAAQILLSASDQSARA